MPIGFDEVVSNKVVTMSIFADIGAISIEIASCWADDSRWAIAVAEVLVKSQDMIG